jgi:23S rRNA-/tRNA-specific pseudouridylate synthase
VSLVELEPVTGRSHQLRVHLAWLGCPVLHDPLYAHAPADARGRAGSLALRSMRLAFPHPRSGAAVALEAPWPTDGAWSAFAGRGAPPPT